MKWKPTSGIIRLNPTQNQTAGPHPSSEPSKKVDKAYTPGWSRWTLGNKEITINRAKTNQKARVVFLSKGAKVRTSRNLI